MDGHHVPGPFHDQTALLEKVVRLGAQRPQAQRLPIVELRLLLPPRPDPPGGEPPALDRGLLRAPGPQKVHTQRQKLIELGLGKVLGLHTEATGVGRAGQRAPKQTTEVHATHPATLSGRNGLLGALLAGARVPIRATSIDQLTERLNGQLRR